MTVYILPRLHSSVWLVGLKPSLYHIICPVPASILNDVGSCLYHHIISYSNGFGARTTPATLCLLLIVLLVPTQTADHSLDKVSSLLITLVMDI